jgi:hypothetical protein
LPFWFSHLPIFDVGPELEQAAAAGTAWLQFVDARWRATCASDFISLCLAAGCGWYWKWKGEGIGSLVTDLLQAWKPRAEGDYPPISVLQVWNLRIGWRYLAGLGGYTPISVVWTKENYGDDDKATQMMRR